MELLIKAVIENDLGLLAQLLAQGANPNYVEDYLEVTPLHYAASLGFYDAALLLLTAGANNNEEKLLKMTPLQIAQEKDESLFELLIKMPFVQTSTIH